MTEAGGVGGKSLQLILARELSANLATPMFLIDPAGVLVFYNEAAERLLGQPFDELGETDVNAWSERLEITDTDESRIRRRDTPAGIAFFEKRPTHQVLRATAHDGERVTVEVTAFPLFGRTQESEGVMVIFWEVDGETTS